MQPADKPMHTALPPKPQEQADEEVGVVSIMQPLSGTVARPTEPPMPAPSADPDRGLVLLAQGGDRRAFELLVVRHQRRVARVISRYVRSPHDIEELAQETFLKAFRGLGSFRGESAFSTWLQRIAGYTAQNFLDYARRRPSVAENADENTNTVETSIDIEDPESLLMSRQIAETVSKAVALLPEVEREALLMRELEGLRYDEIAQRAGCPLGTIRTRIFRARERVAEALRPLLESTRGKRW